MIPFGTHIAAALVAGVLASAIPEEMDRAERLTREAERLKCQVIGDQ